MKERLKKIIMFFANPRLLLCLGIAWLITNGWSYILLGLGTILQNTWMTAVAGAYLAFLWIPFTPEKVVTVIIAMVLLKLLFPKDEKTLGILKNLHEKAKVKKRKKKQKNDAMDRENEAPSNNDGKHE